MVTEPKSKASGKAKRRRKPPEEFDLTSMRRCVVTGRSGPERAGLREAVARQTLNLGLLFVADGLYANDLCSMVFASFS